MPGVVAPGPSFKIGVEGAGAVPSDNGGASGNLISTFPWMVTGVSPGGIVIGAAWSVPEANNIVRSGVYLFIFIRQPDSIHRQTYEKLALVIICVTYFCNQKC